MVRYIKDGAYTIVVDDDSPPKGKNSKSSTDGGESSADFGSATDSNLEEGGGSRISTGNADEVQVIEEGNNIDFANPRFILQNLSLAFPKYEDDQTHLLRGRSDVSDIVAKQVCFYCYCALQAFLYNEDMPTILVFGDGYMGTKVIYQLKEYDCAPLIRIFSRGEFSAKEWKKRGFASDTNLSRLMNGQLPCIVLFCSEYSSYHMIYHLLADHHMISDELFIISATLGFQRKKLFNNFTTPSIFRTFVEPQATIRSYHNNGADIFKVLKKEELLSEDNSLNRAFVGDASLPSSKKEDGKEDGIQTPNDIHQFIGTPPSTAFPHEGSGSSKEPLTTKVPFAEGLEGVGDDEKSLGSKSAQHFNDEDEDELGEHNEREGPTMDDSHAESPSHDNESHDNTESHDDSHTKEEDDDETLDTMEEPSEHPHEGTEGDGMSSTVMDHQDDATDPTAGEGSAEQTIGTVEGTVEENTESAVDSIAVGTEREEGKDGEFDPHITANGEALSIKVDEKEDEESKGSSRKSSLRSRRSRPSAAKTATFSEEKIEEKADTTHQNDEDDEEDDVTTSQVSVDSTTSSSIVTDRFGTLMMNINQQAVLLILRRTHDVRNILYILENFYVIHRMSHEEARKLALRNLLGYVETKANTPNARRTGGIMGLTMGGLNGSTGMLTPVATTPTAKAKRINKRNRITVNTLEKILFSMFTGFIMTFQQEFSQTITLGEIMELTNKENIAQARTLALPADDASSLNSSTTPLSINTGAHSYKISIDKDGKHHIAHSVESSVAKKYAHWMHDPKTFEYIFNLDEDYGDEAGAGFDLMRKWDTKAMQKKLLARSSSNSEADYIFQVMETVHIQNKVDIGSNSDARSVSSTLSGGSDNSSKRGTQMFKEFLGHMQNSSTFGRVG
jgi:hypothetical protein